MDSSPKIIALYTFLFTWSYSFADNPEITLNLGLIRGSYMTTLTGRQFSAFRGIPYAKPPTGQLRFKPPQKLTEPLSPQPFDASEDGPQCGQFDLFTRTITGDEDCLVLNVYVPQTSENVTVSSKLPVMVFIHGGGFTCGSGASFAYGPRRLLDHDVILVTFNYRLNVFGFLSTLDDASPGNYGLLDQLEALKWVHDNIEAFGGDPDRVTLFGESAGSYSVGHHLLSNMSSGLFSAAILMSGTPLSVWAYNFDPMPLTEQYALRVGCNQTDSMDLVECLRNVPVGDLLAPLPEFYMMAAVTFRPTLDGTFLTDHPLNLHKNGQIVNKVPIMIGIAEEEGLMFYHFHKEDPSTSFEELITKSTITCTDINDVNRLHNSSELIKKFYFQSVDKSNATEVQQKTIQLFSECLMSTSHYLAIDYYLDLDLKPFVYSFDYTSNHNILEITLGIKGGVATHADDLFFLFDCPVFFGDKATQPNDVNEDKFLELWINFAKYRNPTPEDSKKKLVKWNSSTKDDLQIYHLDDPLRLEKSEIDHELIDFWFNKIPDALKVSTTFN